MCLFINKCHYVNDYDVKPYVADKDLIVCKLLIKRIFKFYTPVVYDRVKLNKPFICDTEVMIVQQDPLRGTFPYVSHGIHAYITKRGLIFSDNTVQRFAIIPKGTKYYVGTDDDVVSDQLIIFSRLGFIKYLRKNRNNKSSFEFLKI